jgi:hypothetical protein
VPTITYDDLEAALHWVSAAAPFENAAYISKATGKVFYSSSDRDIDDELPDDLKMPPCIGRYRTRTISILAAVSHTDSLTNAYPSIDGRFMKSFATEARTGSSKPCWSASVCWTLGSSSNGRRPSQRFVAGLTTKACC